MVRFAAPLLALTLTLTVTSPVAAQSPEELVLPRLIDSLCLDLVEELNGCETAFLLASEGEDNPDAADLILVSDRRATDGGLILLDVRGLAYSGPFFGQSPYLERSESGALLLHEEQTGFGRTPWTQTLTIVHRQEGFLVAGQTYSTYDRIMGGYFACDVNFLTGDWTISADRVNPETDETTYEAAEEGRIAAARPLLADWSQARGLPAPCETGLSAWFNAETP